MHWIYLFLIFILSYILGKTADLCAQTLRQLKQIARMNEFIAAFFILGGVTSMPEIFVAVLSAIQGTPQLSLGNLMGSNIVVLSFMLGLAAVFSGNVSIKGAISKKDFILTLLLTGLPILFVMDGYVSRWEGLFMLAAFGLYLWYFYTKLYKYGKKPGPDIQQDGSKYKQIALFVGAAGSLLGVSYLLVEISIRTAALWGIPVLLVGLLMISVGTNIPEAAFVAKQLSRKKDRYKDIAAGILLGNVVFNTPTLGLLATIRPFEIENMNAIRVTSLLLACTLGMLSYFMAKDKKLSRTEGALMIIIYACFATYLLTTLNLTTS